jgi:membrane associated rhomboid family serine protease
MDPYGEAFEEIVCLEEEPRAHELGLVILSQGEAYWVLEDEKGFHLIVESKSAGRLQKQIELYQEESVNWPPRLPELPEGDASSMAAMMWVLFMVTCFGVSLQWPSLYEAGKVSSEAVIGGQLYRVATALFLHADIGHLAGNLLFGAVFLHLVARYLGPFRAWTAVLLAGSFGNYLNAAIYFPEPHYSVGASTAVFGAVGILAALPVGYRFRHARWRFTRSWAVPLIVGMVFLAWFGTGNERTDTSAHLMGFLCGLPVGLAGGFFRKRLVN